MKKIICTLVIIVSLYCCSKDKYKLNFKFNENAPVYYDLILDYVGKKASLLNNSKASEKRKKEQESITPDMLFKLDGLEHCIIIEKADKGTVDYKHVSYYLKPEENISRVREVLPILNRKIRTHVKVSKYGNINSDERLSFSSKNLITLITKFPSRPVSVGDTWQIPVEYNKDVFRYSKAIVECSSEVKFKDIKYWDNTTIAILDYNTRIKAIDGDESLFSKNEPEYFSFYSFKGRGEFDLENGVWRRFKGLLKMKQKQLLISEDVRKVDLKRIKELPDEVMQLLKGGSCKGLKLGYKKNIKQISEKENESRKHNLSIRNNDATINKNKRSERKEVSDVVYSVQILASSGKLDVTHEKFKKIRNKVFEVIKPKEVYKYKYRVGRTNSFDEALRIKAEISKKGFHGAYIVKE